MPRNNRRVGLIGLLPIALGLAGCAAQAGGFDSESHFLCKSDRDCTVHTSRPYCFERQCVAIMPTDERATPNPLGDASPQSTGGSSDAGGATASRGSGSLPVGLSPIVGLGGEDQTNATYWVKIDPSTGAEVMSVRLPDGIGPAGIGPAGTGTLDAATGRFFIAVSEGNIGPAQYLLTIDANTGAVLSSSPAIDADQVDEVAWVGGDRLVALRRQNGIPSPMVFGTLDPHSGHFAALSTSSQNIVFNGGSAIDIARGRFYQFALGRRGADPSYSVTSLLTMDLATGDIVHQVSLVDPLAALGVDEGGTVVVPVESAGQAALASLDPATGATSLIAHGEPEDKVFRDHFAAFDSAARVFYLLSQDLRLVAFDLASHGVASVPVTRVLSSPAVCPTCTKVAR